MARPAHIKRDWFGQLQINFYQAPEGFVGIHASKQGLGCRYFEMPIEIVDDPNMFHKVHEQAILEWAKPVEAVNDICPICKRRQSWLFRYRGRHFCRYCGSHYDIVDGRMIITRSIYDEN